MNQANEGRVPLTHEECIQVMLRMYEDARLLAASSSPYFPVRGRHLLAQLHNMVKSQAPFIEVGHLVDVI